MMEIMVATMPWHVLGLQMVPGGHAKMVQGARWGCESWPSPSNGHLHIVPFIHRQTPQLA